MDTTTLTVTAKGQVTLKREVLDHLGIGPGDKVVVESVTPGRVELRAAPRTGRIEEFFGCLWDPSGPVLSIEEIDEMAHRGWAGELDSDP